jgi:hypothetical protein
MGTAGPTTSRRRGGPLAIVGSDEAVAHNDNVVVLHGQV